MNAHFHHQTIAIAILTIATAAIGAGLFTADFQTGEILLERGLSPFGARLKLGFAGLALAFYATVLKSVRDIFLRDQKVTSRQVAAGPLFRLYMVLGYISLIFIISVFEDPARI